MEDNEIEKILRKKYLDIIKKSGKEGVEENIVYTLDFTSFERFINENENVVVDFFAEWCGPCKMMKPIFEQLAKEVSASIKFAKLNVDQSPEIAEKFFIMGVPTIIFFKSGKVIEKIVGAVSKDILRRKLREVYGI